MYLETDWLSYRVADRDLYRNPATARQKNRLSGTQNKGTDKVEVKEPLFEDSIKAKERGESGKRERRRIGRMAKRGHKSSKRQECDMELQIPADLFQVFALLCQSKSICDKILN